MVRQLRAETLTLILVNLAGIMERADEAVLPGVYKEVGAALHTDPTGLGSLTLFRSIVQTSCYPLAAYLAVRHDRTHVIAWGAFLWAAATFLVGFSTNFAQPVVYELQNYAPGLVNQLPNWIHDYLIFYQIAVSRGLNGIGLAMVIPAIQSLVADLTDETNRGTAFGWLSLTSGFGAIIGGFLSVLIASTSFMGIPGWRIAFHLVGLLSVVVGILVGLFARDPHFVDNNGNARQHAPRKPFRSEIKDLIDEAKSVMRIPTFQILIAQGVFGSFPGRALSFLAMWLELIGFSHKTTAIIYTIYDVARSIGSLLGGQMGDAISEKLPNAGRIILSQISSGSVIPFAAILLLALPDDPSSAVSHGLVLCIMGLTTSWNAPATNNPMMAEIVPERARTSIYALDRSFESIFASFAPPIVGILAQHTFGYKPIPKGSTNSEEIAADRENAAALSKALYTAIGIPVVISCFIYSFLYCTYPRDRDRAKMEALIEAEMQKMETDRLLLQEESTQLDFLESDDELQTVGTIFNVGNTKSCKLKSCEDSETPKVVKIHQEL